MADIQVARLGGPALFYRKLITLPCSDAAFWDQTVRVLRAALDSSLSGGIAGSLRFDDFFARSFWFDLRAIRSKHLLIEFTAEPDLNISLSKLETEFTTVFNEIILQGIPKKTIKLIKKRFHGHLDDVLKRKNYSKNLLIDRVSKRRPYYGLTAERRALRSVTTQKINGLLTALGQSGRTVIYRANELWKRTVQVTRYFLFLRQSCFWAAKSALISAAWRKRKDKTTNNFFACTRGSENNNRDVRPPCALLSGQ